MSVVVFFLFFSTICFRRWGYKNSCGARWAGSFCSPLCELATILPLDPYFSRKRYIKVRSGVLFGFCLVSAKWLCVSCVSVSWPSGCFFLVLGVGFLVPCDFPVFRFLRFFWAFRLLAFSLLALLHLAFFSLRIGKEQSPVLPAAMDPGPPPAVHWRVPGCPSPAGSRPWNTPVHSWRGVRDSL